MGKTPLGDRTADCLLSVVHGSGIYRKAPGKAIEVKHPGRMGRASTLEGVLPSTEEKATEEDHAVKIGLFGDRQTYAGWLSIIVPLLLVIAACFSCSDGDDSEAIRRLIETGAGLAEEHDIGGILDLATRDLVARPGELNRTAVKGVLWRAFGYYGRLKVLYPRPEVEIKEDPARAVARFPFLIVKKDQGFPGLEKLTDDPLAWVREVGQSADLYRLELQLIKQDGEWRVNLAHLERFSGAGFQD